MNNHILDEGITNRIIECKRTLKLHQEHIHFWKSKRFGDSAILQLITQKIYDPSISVINVYTNDKFLAKECLEYRDSEGTIPTCAINILEYKTGEETSLPTDSISYPKQIKEVEAAMWRNNIYIPEFNGNDSLAEETAPIPTLSGNELVTKYWAWYVHGKDHYRIYKKIHLHEGETVSVNIVSFDNQCDVYASLMAFREIDQTQTYSEPVSLSGSTWKTLTFEVDKDYDYINIVLVPEKDSTFNGEWNGMDGFIDDFKITQS